MRILRSSSIFLTCAEDFFLRRFFFRPNIPLFLYIICTRTTITILCLSPCFLLETWLFVRLKAWTWLCPVIFRGPGERHMWTSLEVARGESESLRDLTRPFFPTDACFITQLPAEGVLFLRLTEEKTGLSLSGNNKPTLMSLLFSLSVSLLEVNPSVLQYSYNLTLLALRSDSFRCFCFISVLLVWLLFIRHVLRPRLPSANSASILR